MRVAERHVLTEAEYLAMEEKSPLRHEFVAGEAYAMTDGTLRHNRIALNVAVALLERLREKPCQVFINDVKLKVAPDNAYYYPDVMVVCTDLSAAADKSQVVSNPVLVIEVLSEGTEAIDRREKMIAYRRLPSLQEYVLISLDEQRVEIFRRRGDITWLDITYEPGDAVEFAAVGVTLPIADLYAGTDLV